MKKCHKSYFGGKYFLFEIILNISIGYKWVPFREKKNNCYVKEIKLYTVKRLMCLLMTILDEEMQKVQINV